MEYPVFFISVCVIITIADRAMPGNIAKKVGRRHNSGDYAYKHGAKRIQLCIAGKPQTGRYAG